MCDESGFSMTHFAASSSPEMLGELPQYLGPSAQRGSTNCDVCGRPDGRPHYGTRAACNACRSFFGRSVRLNISYSCAYAYDCDVIEIDGRQSCKKCRLQKCLQVGMKPGAVLPSGDPRTGRWRRGGGSGKSLAIAPAAKPVSKSVLNRLSNGSLQFNVAQPQQQQPQPQQQQPQQQQPQPISTLKEMKEEAEADAEVAVVAWPLEQFQKMPSLSTLREYRKCMSQAFGFTKQFSQNLEIELESQKPKSFDCESCRKQYVHGLTYKKAFAVVEAAKQLESFVFLPTSDQVSLLRAFTPAVIILDDILRSTGMRDSLLLCDRISLMPCDRNRYPLAFAVKHELGPAVEHQNADPVECTLLKYILFWNSDVCHRESKSVIRDIQYLCTSTLEQYVLHKYPKCYGRFGTLMMLLAKLEIFATNYRQTVSLCRQQADPLVVEILATEP